MQKIISISNYPEGFYPNPLTFTTSKGYLFVDESSVNWFGQNAGERRIPVQES
jgi:hypothetical protein